MEKMMKKLMFALIAAVCCSSLMANVLIYDYSASFKRINVTGPVKVKDGSKSGELDSPKVASDKITGYMVIAECSNCGGSGLTVRSSADDGLPGNFAVVYIKRNGGNFKYAGNTYQLKDAIYRAIGRFYAGMFGAKSGIERKEGNLLNGKKFTDAEGFLNYRITAGGTSGKDAYAGFLGIGHSGVADLDWWATEHYLYDTRMDIDYNVVENAGFGKVYLKEEKGSSDCWGETAGSECWRVKNLSGSMVGGFGYTGVCSGFLYDVCQITVITRAPISGTFTLKLNNSLSFKDAVTSFKEAEDIILEKMGATKKSGKSTVIDYSKLFCDPRETAEFEKIYVGEDLYDAPAWLGAPKK